MKKKNWACCFIPEKMQHARGDNCPSITNMTWLCCAWLCVESCEQSRKANGYASIDIYIFNVSFTKFVLIYEKRLAKFTAEISYGLYIYLLWIHEMSKGRFISCNILCSGMNWTSTCNYHSMQSQFFIKWFQIKSKPNKIRLLYNLPNLDLFIDFERMANLCVHALEGKDV